MAKKGKPKYTNHTGIPVVQAKGQKMQVLNQITLELIYQVISELWGDKLEGEILWEIEPMVFRYVLNSEGTLSEKPEECTISIPVPDNFVDDREVADALSVISHALEDEGIIEFTLDIHPVPWFDTEDQLL
jgi:hypothetical protein